MDNLSAVLYGIGDIRLENPPIRDPEPNEVQIAVKACGLCMTDVHLLDAGNVGDIVITSPTVIGHEFGGVVLKTGSGVTNAKPGDRVAVDSVVSCGACKLCKLGRSNVCLKHFYHGIPPRNGGMTRTATVLANTVHRIADHVDYEEAALMEPLGVAVHGVMRGGVRAGDIVVVLGAGPIGLLTLQVARAQAAAAVCVTDVDEARLALAKELGATHTVLFSQEETDPRANAQRVIAEIGDDADVALECSGAPVCLQSSVYCLRPGGVLVTIGIGPDEVTFPIVDAILREIDIRGCVGNNYNYPVSIKLVASGTVKLKPIISHRLPLEQIETALDLVRKRQVIKLVVDCSRDGSC